MRHALFVAVVVSASLPALAHGQTRSRGGFLPPQPGQFGPRFVPPEGFPPANVAEALEQASVIGKDAVSVAAVRLTPLPPRGVYPSLLVAILVEGPRAKLLTAAWDEKGGKHLPQLVIQGDKEACEIVVGSLVTGPMTDGIVEDKNEKLGLHFIVPRGSKGPFRLTLPAANDTPSAFQFRVLDRHSSAPPHGEPKVSDLAPKTLPPVAGRVEVKSKSKPAPKPAEPLELVATHTITPGVRGAITPPVVAGKGGRHVEAYEEGTAAERAKLVKDGEVFLIDGPTPVAVESTRAGWTYCRPTEGPHKGKLLTVREGVAAAVK